MKSLDNISKTYSINFFFFFVLTLFFITSRTLIWLVLRVYLFSSKFLWRNLFSTGGSKNKNKNNDYIIAYVRLCVFYFQNGKQSSDRNQAQVASLILTIQVTNRVIEVFKKNRVGSVNLAIYDIKTFYRNITRKEVSVHGHYNTGSGFIPSSRLVMNKWKIIKIAILKTYYRKEIHLTLSIPTGPQSPDR